jgi:hypothetical protein
MNGCSRMLMASATIFQPAISESENVGELHLSTFWKPRAVFLYFVLVSIFAIRTSDESVSPDPRYAPISGLRPIFDQVGYTRAGKTTENVG